MIEEILDKGINYHIGEELQIIGGTLNIDISSGIVLPTILQVNEIDSNGGILQLNIKQKGKYIISPKNPIKTKSLYGTNCEIKLQYKESDNRKIVERMIRNITVRDKKTYIDLDYALPPNIKDGKLYVEKSILFLNSLYLGPTEKNINYEIYRNFTPNCRFPLMTKNNLSPDIVINNALLKLDEEIGKIKRKLGI